MICILKTEHSRGHWLFATDMLDARHKAEANHEPQLAAELGELVLDATHAVHELPTGHVVFLD